MKWLLTVPADLDLDELRQEVEAAGGKLEGRDPVPLEKGEQVVYGEGPDDLHERLSKSDMPIKANRSSPMERY